MAQAEQTHGADLDAKAPPPAPSRAGRPRPPRCTRRWPRCSHGCNPASWPVAMRGRRLTHRDWEPRSPPGSAGQVAPTWRCSSPPIATATGRLWVPPAPGLSARRYRAIDQVSRREARVYSARMSGIVTWNTGRRRVAATLVACLVGTWLAAPAPPTMCRPGTRPGSVLVLQAIGIIVNKPGDMDEIGDKIDDALNAPKKEGVDLAQVQAAKDALDTGDMGQARTL